MFGTTHIFTTCLTRSMIFRHQVPAQALLLFGGLTCAYQSCFSMGCKYERDFRAGARAGIFRGSHVSKWRSTLRAAPRGLQDTTRSSGAYAAVGHDRAGEHIQGPARRAPCLFIPALWAVQQGSARRAQMCSVSRTAGHTGHVRRGTSCHRAHCPAAAHSRLLRCPAPACSRRDTELGHAARAGREPVPPLPRPPGPRRLHRPRQPRQRRRRQAPGLHPGLFLCDGLRHGYHRLLPPARHWWAGPGWVPREGCWRAGESAAPCTCSSPQGAGREHAQAVAPPGQELTGHTPISGKASCVLPGPPTLVPPPARLPTMAPPSAPPL